MWGLALVLAVALAGCASYSTRLARLRPTVRDGDLEAALQQVEQVSHPGELLYHLERGALLHYAGHYAESNGELDAASLRLEELYTISLSERGLTFLLNDEIEDYRGEVHEGSYLHYLRILNYLALGDREGAAVEARALAQRLTALSDAEAQDPVARSDPFLHYIVAVVLDSYAEWDNALVSYRLAREAWGNADCACGSEAPPWLLAELSRVAARAGVRLEQIGIPQDSGEAPPADSVCLSSSLEAASGEGTLLVLFESGWAPQKRSEHLRIPIFRDDPEWTGEEGARSGANVLAERLGHHRAQGAWSDHDHELAYMLDVALPVLALEEPGPSACRVTLTAAAAGRDARGEEGGDAPAATPGAEALRSARTLDVPLADVACRVRATFARGEPGTIVKTLARALLKYFGQREAEKHGGKLAGILANVGGLATEKADTRSWLMLPARVDAARVAAPPGRYHVLLEAFAADGRRLDATEREITIAGGTIELLAWRSFAH